MILVIFGAGASYDSLPSLRPSSGDSQASRPPLADELFSNRPIFAKTLTDFPDCYPIVPYLQAAPTGTVEHTLEILEQEAETDPKRKQQMAAIRYYLQNAIGECERKWNGVTRGITNYLTLLDQLRLMRRPDEPVCLVTFNYDRMIERVLPSVGVTIKKDISEYIAHDAFKLFKLHGSVDWGREIDTPEIKVEKRDTREVARELIQKADQLTISTRYRLVDGRPIGASADGVALFPAIAVPVETKRQYECPDEHLECLRAYLPKITKVLLIGWRATEQHFLNLLRESLTSGVPLYAVAADRQKAEEVLETIERADVRVAGRASEGGFSDFIVSREAEEFLRS